MGIAAVVLGIGSIVVWCFLNPFVGIPFGIVSIILARKEKRRLSMRRIGLVLGIIGLAVSTVDSIFVLLR
jgi:hypothetical protein